eukprot:TRINITY_DN13225_c0_g1_i1.p1 TRINITY_DN13225_c0_g1~~TRINITY_DN13225_c0_g1_i1.p1  ORF type:complete len:285 (-),score=59.45 TRINITY_DN13225_c0_g1_i1:58-867(-)
MVSFLFLCLILLNRATKIVPVGEGDQELSPNQLVAKWSFHNSKERVLVQFYAPWCGACKKFQSTWKTIQELLKPHIILTQVNCEANKEACIRGFNIQSYPTISLFQNGKEARYFGERDAASVITWALTFTPTEEFVPGKVNLAKELKGKVQEDRLPWDSYVKSGLIKVLESSSFFPEISNGWWLVKFHIGSGFDQDRIPLVLETAEKLRGEVNVGVINVYDSPELIKSLSLHSFPALVLWKDGKRVGSWQGGRSLVDWVQNLRATKHDL